MSKKKLRRSGANIMASLILLLGSLAYIMILAVINGSIGFICAMGVTVFGAVGVAKALGEAIALSYGLIIGLAVGCGVLRGILRYFEQYSNHFIAFKLLAVLRDKIFGALRTLAPAKLESKQKGSIIAMITSDIETLEVFYAHTISPIAIAVLVSTAVFLFVGFVSSWYLALAAVVAYLVIGIVVPMISSSRLKESGVKYRAEFASFNAYFLDSIKGIKDIVLNNAGAEREKEVNKRSELLLKETKKMKHNSTRAAAATELTVSLFIIASFEVYEGERLLLLGENGCGKTTLMRLLARLYKPTIGEIVQTLNPKFGKRYHGKKWFKAVGVVYQNPNYQLFMPTVEQEIAFGALSKEYADEMIALFGLEHLRKRHPQSLSEGQKRRVSIAAVAATNPKVLLLDEPTVGQDYKGLCELVKILDMLHDRSGNTMITITHDMRCAEALCDRAILIADGTVKEQGGKELAHKYFFRTTI